MSEMLNFTTYKANKILLVEEVGIINLALALLYKTLSYQVLYLGVSNFSNRRLLDHFLKIMSIEQLDFGKIFIADFSERFSIRLELSEKIYKKLKLETKLDKIKRVLFDSAIEDLKLKAVLIDAFDSMVAKNDLLVMACRCLSPQMEKIVVLGLHSRFLYNILGDSYLERGNCFLALKALSPFSVIQFFLGYSIKCLPGTFKRICSYKKLKGKTEKNHREVSKANNEFKVIFFPHKGVQYGDLFIKDTVYSDSTSSPYHAKNILHAEYKLGSERSKVLDYYKKENLHYVVINSWRFSDLKDLLISSFKTMFVLRENLALTLLLNFLALDVYRYKGCLAFYPNLQVAYIEWDALFPRRLSLALSMMKIKTVSVQGRPILAFAPNCQNMFFDYYFICGRAAKEHFSKSNYGGFESCVELGPPRIELLKRFLLERNSLKKFLLSEMKLSDEFTHIILCFDYLTVNSVSQSLDPIVNWPNNRIFYQDILSLARQHCSCLFIIRGKNDDWCSIDEFSDIHNEILSLGNVVIDRVYDYEARSYRLASIADLVIAKHTSIGDECLAAGIPVLFHDYGVNHEKIFSLLYDYLGLPIYVHSYSELEQRFIDIVNSKDFMSEENFSYLRSYVYANAHTYDVKKELHRYLEEIVC